jgi:hypothetical protein
MKRSFLGALLLAAIYLYPQTPAEVEITNEPYHHFVFENEFVRVFDVVVPPQDVTLMHRHRHDYVFVTIGAADLSNEVEGKPPLHLALQDGETRFVPGGFAHLVRDFASQPFRNITVELLQDEKARTNPAANWDQERGLKVFTGGTQDILFVKDGVRVSEVDLEPRCRAEPPPRRPASIGRGNGSRYPQRR